MIRIDEAGFVEGDFYAPVAIADAQLRLVTAGGNDDASAVLGHVSALVYLRMDQASLCPDVPPPAFTGCAVPDGTYVAVDYADFADTAAYQAYNDAIDFSQPEIFNGGYYTEIITDERAFNDGNSLKISPVYDFYGLTQTAGFAVNEDMTFMIRFYMDAFVHNGSGVRDGFIIIAPYTNDQYLNLIVNDADRLRMNFRDTFTPSITYAEDDIGPASLIFDRDVEILFRLWRIDASTRGVRVYIQEPCATPELVYEKLDLIDAETGGILDWEYMWNVSSGLVLPTGDLWIHQTAIATDPTVFGIPL